MMQLTSGDLAAGLSMLLLWLLIAGLIVAFSIARARRRGSTTLALDVTRNASYAFVLLAGAGAVMFGVSILSSSSVSLDDTTASWVAGQHDSATGPTHGGVVENVPFGPRLVIYLGTLLGIFASGAIAWAIYNATRRAGQREPFHRSVSKTFGVVAFVVMVGAIVGELLKQIGMTFAARSLEWPAGLEPPFELAIPLWPFAVAVGLFALSAIFRYGARQQQEAEQLRHETDGLI